MYREHIHIERIDKAHPKCRRKLGDGEHLRRRTFGSFQREQDGTRVDSERSVRYSQSSLDGLNGDKLMEMNENLDTGGWLNGWEGSIVTAPTL